MISPQARIVKRIIKVGSKKLPDLSSMNEQRQTFERNMRLLFPTVSGKHIKRDSIVGVQVEWVVPLRATQRTIVYVHGGAFALGSSRAYRQHLVRLARICNAKVLSIDYSLAPEYPYPHAVNQLCAVWKELVEQRDFKPAKLVLAGDSAGANIILAAMHRLRDDRLPLPACLVLLSAGLDATFDGESYKQNKTKDPMFTMDTLDFYMRAYVQNHDKKDPMVSPVFADLHGFPPMLIHVGSDELMLSSSIKLHENAKEDGVDTVLYVGEGMWHNWHLFAGFVPEAKKAMREIGKYIVDHTR